MKIKKKIKKVIKEHKEKEKKEALLTSFIIQERNNRLIF